MALGFVIGLTIGGFLGILLAPTFHAWLGRLEWRAASREIQLTERLLQSLESGLEPPTGPSDFSARV